MGLWGAELPQNHFLPRDDEEITQGRVWKRLGWWFGGSGHSRFLPQLSPTDDPDSVYIYDLMATVVHILDSRTGGSLVGHIKVGETYHQRKEVRPCRTPPRDPSAPGSLPKGPPWRDLSFLGLSAKPGVFG